MKKSLFIVLIAAISCVKETPQVEKYENDALGTFQEVSFEATLPSHVNDVKSQIDGENHVTWSAGDVVKICMPAYEGYESYKKYYGVTQVFTSQGSGGEGRALFKGTWNTSAQCKSNGFVFYPQSVEFESIVNNTDWTKSTTTYYTLPQVQDAVDNTFASNLNPSYAPITKADLDANNAQVTFLNICSLLRITLPSEDYHLKKITIESTSDNGSGRLSGKAQLSLVSVSPGNEIVSYVSTSPQIILQRPDGDESELTPGASYYAVVWAGNNHKGLRFTFTNKDGKECVKEYASQVNFYRNVCKTVSITSGLDFSDAPYLNCDQEDFILAARGATHTFTYTANNDVEVSVSDNNWLTISHVGMQVTVEAMENTEPVSRSATITMKSSNLTKQITVTQPPVYYQSTTGTPITTAASLEDGALYMIYFATGNSNNQIDSYCWKTDYTTGDVSAYQFSDKTANATCDLVFKFTKSSTISGSWQTDGQDYLSASSGYLSSEYNKKYQAASGSTILDFAASDTGSAAELIFANQWSTDSVYGSDIDIWNSAARSNTIYWSGGTSRTSGALGWGSTSNVPRKWFFVKVQEVE